MTALVSGIVFALTAPPVDFHLGVLLGLAGLFLALTPRLDAVGVPQKRRAFLLGWLWASAAGLVGLRFVPQVVDRFTPLGLAGGAALLVLLAAFQGLGFGVGAVLSELLSRRLQWDRRLAFPCGIFLACVWPSVFGWTPAGLLSPWLPLVQLADVVGERGVSVLLAGLMACLAWPLAGRLPWTSPSRGTSAPLPGAESSGAESSGAGSSGAPVPSPAPPSRRLTLLSVGLGGVGLMALYGYGALRLASLAESPSSSSETLRVALVQPAVDARLRWEPQERARLLARLRRLTQGAEAQGAELSIWPEAAYPYVLPHRAGEAPRGARAIHRDSVRGPVLFGVLTESPSGEGQYNAATLVDARGHQQLPQAKLELLWFGEALPFGQSIPWLRRTFYRAGGLIPGDEVALLRVTTRGGHEARLGVLNCYEDTLPGVGRRIAQASPNLLVNVTNDGWFEGSIEPELHLRLSVMRAIEARRDLVRAVNLGLPAWIDRRGQLRAVGQPSPAGVLLVTPSLNDESPTFYVKAGDRPLWVLFALACLYSAWRRRTAAATR
ncbi:MAG: apolipoprotein N-acyltransferase [Polyangiaceae bacterium]|nr:apolipoprotein N-acyltransferase [Polyangiaceae bacterium]MCW5792488.1 apolipoprotein N-acyltransferase [Polyangiaceae bacterium]